MMKFLSLLPQTPAYLRQKLPIIVPHSVPAMTSFVTMVAVSGLRSFAMDNAIAPRARTRSIVKEVRANFIIFHTRFGKTDNFVNSLSFHSTDRRIF